MEEEHLLEVFKFIIEQNPHAVLSGSLALRLQNFELPRLSEDIDIYIPFESEFIPFYGEDLYKVGLPSLYTNDTWVEIEEEKTKRTSYNYGLHKEGQPYIDLKVDVFQPLRKTNVALSVIYCNAIPCEHFSNILKRKTFYALNGSEKHKTDLIYILKNNQSSPSNEEEDDFELKDSYHSISIFFKSKRNSEPFLPIFNIYKAVEENNLILLQNTIATVPSEMIKVGSRDKLMGAIRRKSNFRIHIQTLYVDTNSRWDTNICINKNGNLSVSSREYDDFDF